MPNFSSFAMIAALTRISFGALIATACLASSHAASGPATALPDSADYEFSQRLESISKDYSIVGASLDRGDGKLVSTLAASMDTRLQPFTRLETAWSSTLPFTAVSMRLGDAVSHPGTWGNAVRFGGIKLGSLQDLPADIVAAPELTAGHKTLTSSADLIGQNMDRLARLTPAGNVALGVKDVLGHQREISKPLYSDITMMAKGKTDYSLAAGRVREEFALTDGEYGSRFSSATVRYGLRKSLTVDAHAAQVEGVASVVGAGLAKDAGAHGKVSATMATSRSEPLQDSPTGKTDGWLARLAYQIANDYFTVGLRTRVQSATYRDLSGEEESSSPLHWRTLASVAFRLGTRGDLLLAGAMQTLHDASRADFVSLRHNVSLGTAGQFTTSLTYNTGKDDPAAASIAFTRPFGGNTVKR